MLQVNVVVSEQRMLGLMIRGGNEFGLGIYVTGVDNGSVAENAGLKVRNALTSCLKFDACRNLMSGVTCGKSRTRQHIEQSPEAFHPSHTHTHTHRHVHIDTHTHAHACALRHRHRRREDTEDPASQTGPILKLGVNPWAPSSKC